MSRRSNIPRPTEHAALARATRRPVAPAPVLFACLVTAYAVRDREGMRLITHAIARTGGA